MNKLYLIYCVNIFIIIQAAPSTKNETKFFEVINKNFPTNCPILSSNVLVNDSIDYFSKCNDIVLNIPPEPIGLLNVNNYYCIGVLAADIQLCKLLPSGKKYDYLPKDYDDLKQNINQIEKRKAEDICNEFKQSMLFKEPIELFSKWTSELNDKLKGSECVQLCSTLINSELNILCSMLYYINFHIQNITITDNQIVQIKNENTPVKIEPITNKASVASKTAVNPSTITEKNIVKAEEVVPKINIQSAVPEETLQSLKPHGTAPISSTIHNMESDKVPDNTIHNIAKEIPKTSKNTEQHDVTPTKINKESKNPKVNIDPSVNKPPITTEGNDKSIIPQTNSKPAEPDTQQEEVIQNTNLNNVETSSTGTGTEIKTDPDKNDDAQDQYDDVDFEEIPDTKSITNNLQKEKNEITGVRGISHNDESVVVVDDSNFFSYFMFISVMFIAGYVVYHNKQKIMALLLEGRRDRNSRRRPNTASYRKLNSNLEEAVTSKCSGSASHVIY